MRRAAVATLTALAALVALATGPRSARAHDGGNVVRLPAVEVSGLPRSYVTITVAIPEALRAADVVSFEVRLTGLTEVLGRTEGEVRPAESRRVILTLRVPSDALVGILDVADVAFRGPDGDEYVVPIFLRVPAVRGFTVTGAREFRGLRTGDRVELAYRVMNHGNAPDTLEYTVRAPFGWVVRPGGTRTLVIPARTRVEIPASITVPAIANVGDHTISLYVRAKRDAVAERQVGTVLGVAGAATRNGGFILRPTVAGAASRAGSVTFFGAELSGPVAEDVHFSVRMAPQPRATGAAMQGLTSTGAVGMPFAASLSGTDWTANAGNVGGEIGTLTGTNLSGQGVRVSRETERFDARVIAARPNLGRKTAGGGSLFGAAYSHSLPFGALGGSFSRLEEPGTAIAGRQLTAVGADYTSRRIGTVVASGALAYRASDFASGIGASVGLEHVRPGERASLRFAHAPGGSAAFARAVDELQLAGARELTDRWSVDLMYSQSRDEGRVLRRSLSRGLSLSQRYRVSDDGTVSLRAQASRFDASTDTTSFGSFGTEDRNLTAGVDWHFGTMAVTAEAAQGVVARRTELLGGRIAEASTGQQALRVDASRTLPRIGYLGAGAALQFTGAGVGLPARIWTVSGRWSSAPMLLLGRPAQVSSAVGYQQLGAARPAVHARAGMRVALPVGVDLTLSLERNPFFRDAQGRAGTVAAFSLTTTTRVLSTTMLGPDGYVFEDRNMNGRRDANEPGVGGVVVRRGADRVVSRRDGRYRLPAASRGRTRVDLSSLPVGLVAHPRHGADSVEIRDIPLLATGSVRVELKPTPDADGRVPNVDLTSAVVMLRDATGFEWVGRRTDSTTAIFEGIPTGQYTLRLDLSSLNEPVRVEQDLTVEVAPHVRTTLAVPVRGRVIRIISPPGRSGRASR